MSDDPRASEKSWCLFRSGSRTFAIGLESVVEIIEAAGLERIPLSPACVRGYCTYRRDAVPVVSLADHRVSMPARSAGPLMVLVLRHDQETWGIEIERDGAVVVPETEMNPFPSDSHDGSGPVLVGSIDRAGEIYGVIDAAATWRRLRESIEKWYGSQHARAVRRTLEPTQIGAGPP